MADPLYFWMRFYCADSNHIPVSQPPPGPYWLSGWVYSEMGEAVVVAIIQAATLEGALALARAEWPGSRDFDVESLTEPPEVPGRFFYPSWWSRDPWGFAEAPEQDEGAPP